MNYFDILLINKCIIILILLSLLYYIFDEIYFKNETINYQVIISLTTTKDKLKALLVDGLIKSLLSQTLKPYKILISICKIDTCYLSDSLKNYVERNIIELIFINEDLKAFNKYYYIPDKYKNYTIIVINDDIVLENNFIENLYKSYLLYPNSISARRVYKMIFDKQWILKPFYKWKIVHNEFKPKYSLFAIHGEGALFPPNILNFTDDFIFYFKKIINADDFIIKYFELQNNLKTVFVNNTKIYSPLNITFYQYYSKLLSISPNEYQLALDFGEKFDLNLYNDIVKEKVTISKKTKEYFLKTKNNNTISNDTLLISMTSYPKRINRTADVFLSLLNQSTNISSYQCFLTLAKEEFIKGEKDLPLDIQKLIKNGWIKIIWHHNIYSHKKLFPILQNYPENDILIIDDDIMRTYNFIEIFQKEHIKYPRDIICGIFMFYFDNNIEMKRLNGYKSKKSGLMNSVPNIIFKTARPANGVGGVLYPKHTFSDKRFFNETLYMNLTPSSDESWQYTFNIIENKIMRQTSIIIDNAFNIINGSQNSTLYKLNKDKYALINFDLIKLFPEYKKNSIKRLKDIIVSLTSHELRIKKLNLVLDSIFNNTMKPSKIVLTLYKRDLLFLTKYLKDLIYNKKIELIITNKKLKFHNKYFEVMKKYYNYAIITIDDDIIYTNDLIETLYNSYTKYPNYIHARCVHKIISKNIDNEDYHIFKNYKFEFNPSFDLFASTKGGVLFPPNILNISDDNLNEIYKNLNEVDNYLKSLSRKKNIKIVWTPNIHLLGLKRINY